MSRSKRSKISKEKDPSRFFSMKPNFQGASVGNFVNNMKSLASPVTKVVKKVIESGRESDRLTKAAEDEYKKSQGGSYSVNEGTIGEIMKIKRRLKKSKK